MFKAVNNLREQKGFTLIELLIVIAIIGILAAIAIPAFLGQREKAKQRSMESSARSMLSEVQAVLDDFVAGQAMVFIVDAQGTQNCFDSPSLNVPDKYKCPGMFPDLTDGGSYTTVISSVLQLLIDEHTAKGELSPYTGEPLLVAAPVSATCAQGTTGTAGRITFCYPNNYSTIIIANASTESMLVELYRGLVSAK